MISGRPMPPVDLVDIGDNWDLLDTFRPAPDLAAWIRSTFIDDGAPLHNPTYEHLADATVGCLWTNTLNTRGGRRIIGQCEFGRPQGAMGKWAKARAAQQVREWFGSEPDFILTFDAIHSAECDDASFLALVEHELHHAGQATDEFGAPKFTKEGRPVFSIRQHDIEEFVGVVERYGAQATGITRLIEAAQRGPTIAPAKIAAACGTCQKLA